MGFTEILTIIFVICKLLNVIDWFWWLVFLSEIIAVGGYIILVILNILVLAGIITSGHIKLKRFRKRNN